MKARLAIRIFFPSLGDASVVVARISVISIDYLADNSYFGFQIVKLLAGGEFIQSLLDKAGRLEY